MTSQQDQLNAAALLATKLDDLLVGSISPNGKNTPGQYNGNSMNADTRIGGGRKGGADASRHRGAVPAQAATDDDSDLDSDSDMSEESDEAAAIERIEQERIENIRKWKYRREAYKQLSAAFYEMCWRPFLICASGAFGLSFGYALYDFVADKFFFWRKRK